MRRVLVVNQFALPRSEAGGTRHVDLFGRLTGWQPVIVAGNRNHYSQDVFTTKDQRFRLVPVPPQRGGPAGRLAGWLAFSLQVLVVGLTCRRLDLVVGSTPQPFGALVGLLAARLRRVPFVLEVRDLWPESLVAAGLMVRGGSAYRVFRSIERLLVTRAARVLCVTEGWQAHFADLGVAANSLVVVPNGTEPADFEVEDSREELRRSAGIAGFTAIFAGAHGPKDGIDLVLDAASQLPGISFLLVGSGPVKAKAVHRARDEGLDNVEFRDPVPKKDLARLLRACDVGIHAVTPLSVFDNGMSPNKLFDYMAAQLPVVSNAATALRRIAEDGYCGRFGAADELPHCLSAVYEATPEQRRAWGQRSLQIVSGRFSRSSTAQLLTRTLNSACGVDDDEEDR